MTIGAVSVLSFRIEDTEGRFNRILEEYGSFLRNSIAAVCPRDLGIQIDDIEQEARIRLWKALQKQTDIEDHASYIYRIAFTTTIDAVRRVKARKEEQLQEQPTSDESESTILPERFAVERRPGQDKEFHYREVLQKVEEVLSELLEERRTAVRLHLNGLSSNEIANVLNWSEPKARNLLYRGLKDLRSGLRIRGIDYTI